MERNLSKNIQKIFTAFGNLNVNTKKFIKIGLRIFIALFAIGTIFLGVSHYVFHFDSYFSFIANSIVKSSFTILAEVIIGCLLVDYIFNR